MSNLKSAYFYFLAIKINITKLLKKIYFTTNFYNNSLNSKSPSQFYFYPNPFLLSSLISHKNFMFNFSKINLNEFWNKPPSIKQEKKLHDFFWLNLISRKNDGVTIQKIINIWIDKNLKYKKTVWENTVIGKRIISWILNAEIILSSSDNSFKHNFLKSIVVQVNHLKNIYRYENNYSKKIEIICAILLSGLVFKDLKNNYDLAIKELKKISEDFFDNDGFPQNRSPKDLLKFSKYFILVKECIKDAQEYIPDFLDEIIDKNLLCIKSLKTPLNQLPLFNGSVELNLENYITYIGGLNYKFGKSKYKIGNIQILKYKKNTVYFDVGTHPKKNISSDYQCGPLSFEFYSDDKKIITNCGFGNNISKKAILLSRLTSAQSTICINDTSVIKFERNKNLNAAYGNSIKGNFKILSFEHNDNDQGIMSSASHNAYEKFYGYVHKREIKINKKDESLLGYDVLIKKDKNIETKFNIRFHLNPGIEAVQTISGNSILIHVNKNKSLIFLSPDETVSVEKSIFLGGNKILNNLCINISGNIKNDKKIKWEIRKEI
jgi:uncharacterized heparinase superfamily protein